MIPRILITDKAKHIINQLKAKHGEIIFHQSGGCCDGSSPICLPKGELMLNDIDVWIGRIHDCDFYMSQDQFQYWESTQLTLDIKEGRGASFSLEIPMGIYFIIQSRLFLPKEMEQLTPIRLGE